MMSPSLTSESAHALDGVTFGEVMAMFVAGQPGPLEQVKDYSLALAGAETNVAIGLARLGHRAGWIGRVGAEPFGRFAVAELTASGVDTSMVSVDEDALTGFALKSQVSGGDPEVVYYRKGSAGSLLTSTPDTDAYIAGARHMHLTGIPLALSASTRSFAFRALDVARDAGATISFDPNLRPSLWADHQEMIDVTNECAARADWVLPGLTEATVLTGLSSVEDVAAHYLGGAASVVVIKEGSRGASLHTRNGSLNQDIFAVKVVDTVGAGDGFATGFISAMLDGASHAVALERAAAVGACAVTSSGDKDGLPNREELEFFLAGATTRH
ncbi:MAG: sugar kinase [Arachnia sp.]